MEVSGQFHALADVLRGRSPRFTVDNRSDGLHNRLDIVAASAGNQTLVVQPIA